ncbi:hypothetical protein PG999_008579 [Apiospora kogelbergensis]|uniref:Uncharacterized protein n=1 Tax=Apiospora kogelbergensis TaxID=1337665 RepID=A0AAW0QM68_9PEZI
MHVTVQQQRPAEERPPASPIRSTNKMRKMRHETTFMTPKKPAMISALAGPTAVRTCGASAKAYGCQCQEYEMDDVGFLPRYASDV